MGLLELSQAMIRVLAERAGQLFTGTITFTVKLHKGGISRVEVNTFHTLERLDKQFGEN